MKSVAAVYNPPTRARPRCESVGGGLDEHMAAREFGEGTGSVLRSTFGRAYFPLKMA
jgi:hypothetical protein